jgi:Tfp pilus assembly protein PilX
VQSAHAFIDFLLMLAQIHVHRYARRYRGMMTKDAPMFAQKEAAAEAAIKAREHRIMTQGTEQEKKALEYAKRESKRNNGASDV